MDNLLKKAIKRTSRKKVITQLKIYALVNPRVTRRANNLISRIQHFGTGPGKRNWDPEKYRSTAAPGKPVRPPGLPTGMSIKDMMGGDSAKPGERGYREKSTGSGPNRKIRNEMLAQHMLKKQADITKREARRRVLNDMLRKMSVKVNRAQSDFKRYARKAEAFMADPGNQDKFGPMWMDSNFLTRAQADYLKRTSRPGTPPGERLPPPPTAEELKQIIAKNVSRQQFILGGEAVLSEVPPAPPRSRSAPTPSSAKSLSPMAPAWSPPAPSRSPPNLPFFPASEAELRNMLENWGASKKIRRPQALRP